MGRGVPHGWGEGILFVLVCSEGSVESEEVAVPVILHAVTHVDWSTDGGVCLEEDR